jgi:iron complex outermembrane receptor protein
MYSSNADYQLPNGKYLENTRFKEFGGKLALGYSKKNWVSHLRYTYSNTRAGIPGHSHDSIVNPVSFQMEDQLRTKRIPAQIMENHVVSLENKFFIGQDLLSLTIANATSRLTEFEDKNTLPYLSLNLNNTMLNLQYKKKLSDKIKWITGVQSIYQENKNGSKVEDSLIPNYNQFDVGLYSLIHAKLGTYDIQVGFRADNRVLNVNEEDLQRNFFSPNFSIGAVKNWKKNLLRLNASSGYRAPHVAEMLSNGRHHGSLQYERGNRDLNPEYSIQFDLSYELEQEHLSLVVNPFYNYLLNYISLVPRDSIVDGLPYYEYDQLTQGQLYGIDLGVHYHPHFAHFLHLESSYSYIRAQGRDGQNFSLIPQARINTFLKFDFQMQGAIKLEDIVLQHQFYFDQNFVAPQEASSPSYSLINFGLNASIGESEQLMMGMGVKNLLNTEYINHLSRLRNIDTPHPGRSYYLSIKYQLNNKKQ